MEDFLEIEGTDSGADDSRGGRGDSAVQWSLCDEPSLMQQFMPSKKLKEDNPQNVLLDPITPIAFQPISTTGLNTKVCPAQGPQIHFGMDRNDVQQFSIHAYQNQDAEEYLGSKYLFPVSHMPTPINTGSLFSKVHDPSSGSDLTVTAIKPIPFRSFVPDNNSARKVVKPLLTTGQLTIFYAGSVHVYDNVPSDKAQAIMLMASEGCKPTSNAAHAVVESPELSQTKGLIPDIPTCAQASSTPSLSTHKRNQTGSGSTPSYDQEGVKRVGTTVSTFDDNSSRAMSTSMVAATIFTGAVPQSRKASLARFLERRKERVSNMSPFSVDKTHFDTSTAPQFTSASSACSAPWAFRTNNQDLSCFKGQANNCSGNDDSPSTNLEI